MPALFVVRQGVGPPVGRERSGLDDVLDQRGVLDDRRVRAHARCETEPTCAGERIQSESRQGLSGFDEEPNE